MALAVTPNLYISPQLEDSGIEFDCVYTQWASMAKTYLDQGRTVVVPDEDVAHLTLLLLGLSTEEADRRVDIALYGPSAVNAVDPTAPVPRAPGAVAL